MQKVLCGSIKACWDFETKLNKKKNSLFLFNMIFGSDGVEIIQIGVVRLTMSKLMENPSGPNYWDRIRPLVTTRLPWWKFTFHTFKELQAITTFMDRKES